MNKEEKISFLKKINKRKEKNNIKKKQNEIDEIKENHNELLKLRESVKDFLDVYKEYDNNISLEKPYSTNINEEIKIANGGITIGMVWQNQTITITDKDIKYDIMRYFGSVGKCKTNNIDELLENIKEDMYGILSCLQVKLIVGAKEYMKVKNKEIEEYIEREMKNKYE